MNGATGGEGPSPSQRGEGEFLDQRKTLLSSDLLQKVKNSNNTVIRFAFTPLPQCSEGSFHCT